MIRGRGQRGLGALHAAGRTARLCFTVPECNSLGLALMGGADARARRSSALRAGEADTVIVLENDLYRRARRGRRSTRCSRAAEHVDRPRPPRQRDHGAGRGRPAGRHLRREPTARWSTTRAGPSGSSRCSLPAGDVQRELALAARRHGEPRRRATAALGRPGRRASRRWPTAMPALAPASRGRAAGRLPHGRAEDPAPAAPLQRAHGDARPTCDVHEPQPPEDPDSPLAFSMEGYQGEPPPPLIPRFWAPGWNSVQAVNKFQSEVGGPLRGGDPGRRLIEPGAASRTPATSRDVPPAFAPREGEWLVVPALPHLRLGGAERAHARAWPSWRRSRTWRVDPADAARLGLAEGEDGRAVPGRARPTRCRCAMRAGAAGRRGRPAGRAARRAGRRPARVGPHRPAQAEGDADERDPAHTWSSSSACWSACSPLGRRADLGRAAAAGALAGPLRPEPRRAVRPAAGRGRHDQDLLTKEDWIPPFADKPVFVLAPAIVVIDDAACPSPSSPFAPGIVVADLNIGLLFFLAHVVAGGLQRGAGGLVVEQQVRAAGRPAGRRRRCSATRSSWACR